ncbi:PREDICTED: cyclin-D3-1-like [Tarenaya hassleriana]|uniref:cyclin-D3-1-like n=1 Tax=Tarenaya hassleriana TaxID=28532 RepID=UPI00053C4804|nr:PREDICTED: cyclin-D3-1-like [Tarenaya hassleriana]
MEEQNNEQLQEQEQIINPTFDSLFCSDETYEEGSDNESRAHYSCSYNITENMLCEDDELELEALLAKEAEQGISPLFGRTREPYPDVSGARREAVEWILHATSRHCFSPTTALFAVDFLDRFIFRFEGFRRDQKPWITELAAIGCLSLAAKVEEIHVPLLLDLQVEGTSKFMFEAKTIQKMEILVLSTLQWRMNPVTSLSFLHRISKRFGLKGRIGFEFLRRCELTILSIVSDYRFTLHLPSTVAAATALHVVNSVVTSTIASEYEKQLMSILRIDKDNLEQCLRFVSLSSHGQLRSKRKLGGVAPGSPNGVMDATFSSDGSTDSLITMSSSSSSSSSSVNSSPEPSSKKRKNTTTMAIER